jgi:hypothetical protein
MKDMATRRESQGCTLPIVYTSEVILFLSSLAYMLNNNKLALEATDTAGKILHGNLNSEYGALVRV